MNLMHYHGHRPVFLTEDKTVGAYYPKTSPYRALRS